MIIYVHVYTYLPYLPYQVELARQFCGSGSGILFSADQALAILI